MLSLDDIKKQLPILIWSKILAEIILDDDKCYFCHITNWNIEFFEFLAFQKSLSNLYFFNIF